MQYPIYLLYWYKSAHTDAEARSRGQYLYSVYVLYWYKSTHILTQERARGSSNATLLNTLCNYALLLQHLRRHRDGYRLLKVLSLLYWYKSTDTDAEGAGSEPLASRHTTPTSSATLPRYL